MKRKIAAGLLTSALFLSFGANAKEVHADQVSGHTLSQSMNWSNSTNGVSIDADGSGGAQCVDLTMAYSQYLFGYTMMGNAADYSVNDYPGFTRLSKEQTTPQPGDIAVWVGAYGHVGIITSVNGGTFTTMEQNVSGAPFVQSFTRDEGDFYGLTFWGFQRPNLREAQPIPAVANGIYRMYNASNGDHLYTTDSYEAQMLENQGLQFDGVFFAKSETGTPVYRLYNTSTGEHFYTINATEVEQMSTSGWNNEGISWVAPAQGKDIYRVYGPDGNHVWTSSTAEVDYLLSLGWVNEGVAFKG